MVTPETRSIVDSIKFLGNKFSVGRTHFIRHGGRTRRDKVSIPFTGYNDLRSLLIRKYTRRVRDPVNFP